MFLQVIIASLIGSVCALVGGTLLLWREEFARRISLTLVAFAVGSLIGAAFLELIPEALAEGGGYSAVAPFVVAGIFFIFLFEKVVHWYHAHEENSEGYAGEEQAHSPAHSREQAITASVLTGDAIHNFIDGVAIAFAFSVSTEIGIATTLAVFVHEVPQEIGDFGILLHMGYERSKVFLYNLWVALTTPVGAVVGYFLSGLVAPYIPAFLAFAAGTFLYIAVSDLLPELRHKHAAGGAWHVAAMIAGVLVVALVGAVVPE